MKKILFIFVLFLFINNVRALNYRGCDSSEISRMKALINNINISYDYVMNDQPIFSVTINNITPDMYFIDSETDKEYRYQDTNNGEIVINWYSNGTTGRYKFYSAKSECYGINLGTKYYKTPFYNPYYNDPMCANLNVNICEKWTSVNHSKSEIEALINEYKIRSQNSDYDTPDYEKSILDKIVEFYLKYYLAILLFIIVSCSVVIYISRKKDSFNL